VAWNKLVNQPWRIMSIGLRQWAHRFWSMGLGITHDKEKKKELAQDVFQETVQKFLEKVASDLLEPVGEQIGAPKGAGPGVALVGAGILLVHRPRRHQSRVGADAYERVNRSPFSRGRPIFGQRECSCEGCISRTSEVTRRASIPWRSHLPNL
jgi:hypothetical protein